MKHSPTLVLVIAVGIVLGCKSDSKSTPASGSAAAPASSGVRGPGSSNAQPSMAGSGEPTPGSDHPRRWGDRNGDGAMTDEERASRRHERAQSLHDRLDKDHDGKLTPAELADPARRGPRFDDPAALDTNHDGDISADELAAALKSHDDRRWRHGAGAGSGSE